MSERSHKVLTALAGVAFAGAESLLQSHAFPKLDWLWNLVIAVAGGGGIVALKPLVSGSAPDARTKDQG